jgi:hypothetical protein
MKYAKAVVAVLGGAATVAAAIPPDTTLWRWAQVVLALATAVGVYSVPNKQPLTREALKEQTRAPRADPPPDRPKSRIYQRRPPPPRG